MSNRWVISWLVIDYWRWSMSNRWVIEAQKFCGLSITHRWHRLLIDVIDYSLMTHWLLIDYYTTDERNFSCFLVPFFFLCDSFNCVRPIFPCIWSSCWRSRDAKCLSLIQMIINCAICKTEQSWRGNRQVWSNKNDNWKILENLSSMENGFSILKYWRTFWSIIWKHLFTFKLF